MTLLLAGLFSAPPALAAIPPVPQDAVARADSIYIPVGWSDGVADDSGIFISATPQLVAHNNSGATGGGEVQRVDVDPSIAQFLPELVATTLFCLAMTTMFHLPKFVYSLVEEKQLRLYHAMRLQGLSMVAYWAAIYVYGVAITLFSAAVFIGLGYAFNSAPFVHASPFRYIGAVFVWAHSQMGMAAFASSLVRSPKLATVLFYLVNIMSIMTVVIINNVLARDWHWALLSVPTIAYPRALGLILAEGGGWKMQPMDELARALWISAISGTLLGIVGVLLHVIIPNGACDLYCM